MKSLPLLLILILRQNLWFFWMMAQQKHHWQYMHKHTPQSIVCVVNYSLGNPSSRKATGLISEMVEWIHFSWSSIVQPSSNVPPAPIPSTLIPNTVVTYGLVRPSRWEYSSLWTWWGCHIISGWLQILSYTRYNISLSLSCIILFKNLQTLNHITWKPPKYPLSNKLSFILAVIYFAFSPIFTSHHH